MRMITPITASRNYRHNVLVLDDSATSLMIFSQIAKNHKNTHVADFTDPAEALKWCKNRSLSLIITDYHMQGINGVEFIKAIKKQPKHQHVPILVVTINSDENTHSELIRAGADKVLTKPTRISQLISSVNSLLEKGKRNLTRPFV